MNPEEQAEKRLDISIQTRAAEIELFWKRSFFFWGFIAAAFTGYAALRTIKSDLSVIVACFGMVCSLAWTLLNRGSKYWQESWEVKVERYEAPVVGEVFARTEEVQSWKGPWLQARRYSVSKLSIALSDYVFILWVALLVGELIRRFAPLTFQDCLREVGLLFFLVFSAIYLVLMLVFGRSFRRQ